MLRLNFENEMLLSLLACIFSLIFKNCAVVVNSENKFMVPVANDTYCLYSTGKEFWENAVPAIVPMIIHGKDMFLYMVE